MAAKQRLVVPDLRAVVRAVELDIGVSVVPEYACRRALDERRLVRLIPLDLPPDRWTLAYRNADADREDILAVAAALG